uniref:Uncharacterized protein n=1 Tax=Nelumbo nucifera TaxID=4432 RepID=A0A822Y415_NELNU|nr:TPA_asm: hypothetical protein HUJ06_028480 [Nelumbo nucifera]
MSKNWLLNNKNSNKSENRNPNPSEVIRNPDMTLLELINSINWEQENYPQYDDFKVLPFLAINIINPHNHLTS